MLANIFRLLGLLLARVISSDDATEEGHPLELLSQLFTFYLGSRSALQKCCTACVISEWATAVAVHHSMHRSTILQKSFNMRIIEKNVTRNIVHYSVLTVFYHNYMFML